jgi:P-type E1-E2 ATPase
VVPGSELTENELLVLAAAAERSSEHPLARAVVAAAHERDLPLLDASDFASEPGRGVTATVGGRRVAVGSPLVLGAAAHRDAGVEALVRRLEHAGRTAVVVTVDGVPIGVLGLADRLRPGAADTVDELTELTGRTPVLLTGDNFGTARRLGEEVGIFDVRAELLPHDKVAAVRELQANGHHVTLIGDGVNDAPALAAASTGVAMGRFGSDLAIETADVVIVRDELGTLPAVIDISRRAQRVVKQNLVIAGVVITGLVALDLFGHLPLPLGVAGHEGSTVIVGLNGLRLLWGRSWGVTGARSRRREIARRSGRLRPNGPNG